MLAALISVSIDPSANSAMTGLAPLFGATIVEAQADAALRAGARSLHFVCDHLHPRLLAIADSFRSPTCHCEVIRNIDEAQLAADCDRVMLVDAGTLLTEAVLERTSFDEAAIFVYDADDAPATHERIDLNHRWTGLAILPRTVVSELAALDGEWDNVSALLRMGVQRNIARKRLTFPGFAIKIDNEDGLAEFEAKTIRAHFAGREDNRFGGLVGRLQTILLPAFWRRAASTTWLGASAALLVVIAGAFAMLAWPLPALVALFGSFVPVAQLRIIGELRHRPFSFRPALAGDIATVVLLVMLAFQLADPLFRWESLAIAFALGLSSTAYRRLAKIRSLLRWATPAPVVMGLAALTAFVDFTPAAAILLVLTTLIFAASARLSPDTGAKHV